MKKILLSIAFVLCVGYISAAGTEHPVRKVGEKHYYEYTVKAGDGLYGVARSFGLKPKDLIEVNPELTDAIRPGQIILVPVPADKEAELMREEKQPQETAEVQPLGNACKIHVVQPKQTLYGISRIYDMKVDSLVALNPFAVHGIRPGDTLLIARSVAPVGQEAVPVEPAPGQEEALQESKSQPSAGRQSRPAYHIVRRKETLYAISRQYSMPIHEIIALNPSADRGLRAGDTLMLDTAAYRRAQVPQPVRPEYPAQSEQQVKPVQPVGPVQPMQPAKADTVLMQPVAESSEEEHPAAVDNGQTLLQPAVPDALTIVYLLPFQTGQASVHKSTLRFVEFYRGALVALDKAKESGVSANVYTFDTGRTRSDIDSVLARPEVASADVIVGPAYSDQLEPVLTFARERNIAAVVPFSAKIPEHLYYPGLIQFNPSAEHINSQAVAAIASDRSRRYAIGRFSSVSERDKALADELKAALLSDNVPVIDTVLTYESLRYIVERVGNQPATLLMASSAPADVNLMLDSLAAYQRHNIQVWGFEEWTTLVNKYPNTVYTSLFDAKESADYTGRYNEMFGAHVMMTEPRYDLIGYDLTVLVTRSLNISGGTYRFDVIPNAEYMQSAPLMILDANRYVNNRLSVFHWDGTATHHREFVSLPKTLTEPVANE